jgi:hypothetical protein
MTGEQRVEALWQMVLDALAVKGIHAEPRLHKHIGRIHRPPESGRRPPLR